MDTSKYLPMWNRVAPLMHQHLQAVLAQMAPQGFTHEEILQAGDEEFRLDANVLLDGAIVGGFEFTLHDGEVQDGEGFGIGLRWFGDQAEVLAHAWTPHNYSDEVYTWDEDEILSRLAEFDPVTVAGFASKEFIELRLKKLCKH